MPITLVVATLKISCVYTFTAFLRFAGATVLTALVAGCSAQSPLSPDAVVPASSAFSMAAADWTFESSPNMPRHPRSIGDGWQFDFPTERGVGYLTTRQKPASASQAIRASITVDTIGDPFFEYRTESSNTCAAPATVRLYFQRRGDNLSGNGEYEFYRWWSNPVAYQLGSGSIQLVGNLADPSAWSSVLGRTGSENEPAFRAALADMGAAGFTFGGGCFFGHGVYVAPGTGQAVFTASEFTVS
jgi:hypothetical protein